VGPPCTAVSLAGLETAPADKPFFSDPVVPFAISATIGWGILLSLAADDRPAPETGGDASSPLALSECQFGVIQHLKTALQPLQVTVYKQIGAHEVTVPR
jgi:hypothetical protein